MRKLVVAMALLLAVSAFAEELTVDKIIAAHSFGAPPEKIIEKINDPANTVAPILPGGIEKMKAAGVPDMVIAAMQSKAVPAPQPIQPDNPNLTKVVKLVQSGVTETLLIDLIKQAPDVEPITHGDIIYLKENRVPDAVVAALMANTAAARGTAAGAATGVAAGTAAAAKPATDGTVDGLLLMRGTFLSKNHQGKLTFKADELSWASGTDAKSNFNVKITALERAWMKCQPLPGGNFCFEIGFKIFKSGEYEFRDAGSDKGSNDNVKKVREILQARFPNLVFEEKIEK
jgi:hypothetical protein